MAEDEKIEPATAASTPAPPAPPEPPPNKLHEWVAALVIMLLLGSILYTFLSFMRGAGT